MSQRRKQKENRRANRRARRPRPDTQGGLRVRLTEYGKQLAASYEPFGGVGAVSGMMGEHDLSKLVDGKLVIYGPDGKVKRVVEPLSQQ